MQENEKVLEEGSDTSRIYEVGYHLLPTIPLEQVEHRATEIKALITKHNGVMIDEGMPILIDLAYAIAKVSVGAKQNFKTAYFGWVKFECGAEELKAIEKGIKENENILRFLLIKTVRESTLADKKLYEKQEVAVEGTDASAEVSAGSLKKEEAATEPAKPVAKEEKPAKAAKADKKAPTVEEMDKQIEGLLG